MVELADPALDVTLAELTIPLLQVAGFMVALGCVVVADRLSRALFGALTGSVGWIPWAGKVIAAPLHTIEQRISNTLGGAAAGLSERIGTSLHALGSLVHTLGYEIEQTGRLLATVAYLVASRGATAALGAGLDALAKAEHAVTVRVQALERRLTALEQEVRHAGHGVTAALVQAALAPVVGELRGLERWTYPHVKALEEELHGTVEPDIAALRQRATAIENEAIRAYQAASGLVSVTNAEAFAAALALALPALGLQWARCANVGRLGSALCGLGSDLLEALLGDALLAFAVADICDFAYGAELVAQAVAPALYGLVDVAEALVGCHGADAPAPLALPPLRLPALAAGLPLAG